MRIPAAFRPPTAEIGSSSNVPVMGDPASAIRGAVAALLVLGSTMSPMAKPPPALALDAAAVGTCVVTQCTPELAGCITDGSCLANLLCIQTCNNKPDEADCQIACGDKFSSAKVDSFTKCAVTNKKCVPQRQDDGSWPVPKEEALVKSFNTADFTGPWYISAGLNKAFDTFDCQLHKFESPAPGKLVGNLQWRIKDPVAGTNFVTRYTIQEFVQDAKSPAILYNHDNDFLHYEDDWYVLAQKKGEYVLVYYRGNNDAWDGYGGAVVYSTSAVLNPKYYDEIDAALQTVGHRWSEMTITGTHAAFERRMASTAYRCLSHAGVLSHTLPTPAYPMRVFSLTHSMPVAFCVRHICTRRQHVQGA